MVLLGNLLFPTEIYTIRRTYFQALNIKANLI